MGKRNLESAIAALPPSAPPVSVGWKPFFLRPNMPLDGVDKGPGNRVNPRLKQAGANVGIDFTGLTDRYPNTVKAHTLLAFAERDAGREAQNKLQEILFRHYFTDGRYPDEANLRAAAVEAGLDPERAMAAVADQTLQEATRREAEAASRRGISGVPFFFIDGRPFGSGAQPPAALKEALMAAAAV